MLWVRNSLQLPRWLLEDALGDEEGPWRMNFVQLPSRREQFKKTMRSARVVAWASEENDASAMRGSNHRLDRSP